MKQYTAEQFPHIKGWGIDADPANEPTYPMKHYTGDDHDRLNYERPPLQEETVEVFHSNERPNLTAVYGTTCPPKGASGAIRRYAFRYSEGNWMHWLTLLFADRVNVAEGLIDDIKSGYVPNVFAERGWKGMWKHNKGLVIRKVATGVLVSTVAIALLSRNKKKSKV